MSNEMASILQTLDLIRSGRLDADAIMFTLEPEELMYICNGCGAKGKFDFVPDTIWGMSIKEVCNIHDVDYNFGVTIEDKGKADRRMRNNMLRLIEMKSGRILRRLRQARATTYYNTVSDLGGPAFWAGKNTDKRNL